MKLPIPREDLLDEIADALSDANDLDVGWHKFAAAVLEVLERHGVTFEGERWGCHVELDEGYEPDGCVIDEGVREECIYARNIECKEQCGYWRKVGKP